MDIGTRGEILAPLDDFVGRAAYFFGDLDPKISSLIERIVELGDVALDIGANIGVVAFRLANRVGESGKVYAFEPNPTALAYLQRSIGRNCINNIDPVPFALGDAEGHLSLSIPNGNAGAASACRGDERCQEIRVPVSTLDAFVEERGISRIDFIKIDVEGFEPNVIRGGLNAIRRLRPKAIIFENNDKTESTFELLSSADYKIFSISRALVYSQLHEIQAHSYHSLAYHDCIAVDSNADIRSIIQ